MHVFRTDHLALNQYLVFSSLGRSIPSLSQLYSVASSSLRRIEALWVFFWSSLSCLLVSPLFSSHLGGHVGGPLWVRASDVTRRHNLTAKSLVLWLLKSFCPLFCNVPLPLGVCFVDFFIKTRLQNFVYCHLPFVLWLSSLMRRVGRVIAHSSYHHSLGLVPFSLTAGFFEPHCSPLEKDSCYFPKSQLYARGKQCPEFFSVNTKLSNKKMITSNPLTLNFEGSLFLGAQRYRAIATIRTYLPTFFFYRWSSWEVESSSKVGHFIGSVGTRAQLS